MKNALLFQPTISLIGYALVAFAPMLSLIRLVKVGENSIDYSLQNTARQTLYLVTSRVEKYVGKTTVDTLFVRLGDVLSACVVAGGVQEDMPVLDEQDTVTGGQRPRGTLFGKDDGRVEASDEVEQPRGRLRIEL